MSSLYFRNKVRAHIRYNGVAPFYDTVNRVQDPKDLAWVTLEFFATRSEGMLGCPGYIEYGTVDMIFLCSAGLGDDLILKTVESMVPIMMAFTDEKASISSYEPPRELTGGDADRWYRIGVGFEYMYSY